MKYNNYFLHKNLKKLLDLCIRIEEEKKIIIPMPNNPEFIAKPESIENKTFTNSG